MSERRRTTAEEARRVGDTIGVDWNCFDLEQFRTGWTSSSSTARTTPKQTLRETIPLSRGKIALAHMKEFPDYYERLGRMEAEAERDWAAKRGTGTST